MFKVFDNVQQKNQPTAGNATNHNLGADSRDGKGGYTIFQDTTTAGNAHLIAQGSTVGGMGGQIVFRDCTTGGTSRVSLSGNGTLDLSNHEGGLSLAALEALGGVISLVLQPAQTALVLSDGLTLASEKLTFSFVLPSGQALQPQQSYPILQAANMKEISTSQFSANSIDGTHPTFSIGGNTLSVSYSQD